MYTNLFTPKKNLDNSDSYCFKIENDTIQDLKTAKDSRSPSSEDTECTYNLISRKTLRGRKEKMPLPKNKLKCEICLEYSDFSKEDLISCSTCKCLFHKSCYDQYEIHDKSSYKCIRCFYALQLNKSINEFQCFICGNSNGVLNRNSFTHSFYHKICLYLLNEFKGLEEEDICKEKIRKWRYKNSCRYCGEKLSKAKAVIKCKNPKCKEYYHIPCAIDKGMLFDLNYMKKFYDISSFDEIPFYCANHNKKISFMYKNHVVNNNSSLNCKNNLFQNEFILPENEDNKTFFDCCENFGENKFLRNESTIFVGEDDKIKNSINCINSKEISVIEEENINENYNENCSFQNENQNENENDKTKDNNNNYTYLDTTFENNKNDVFNLNFGTILKENDNNDNHYQEFLGFNSCFRRSNSCNDDDIISFYRQNSINSINSIPFDV